MSTPVISNKKAHFEYEILDKFVAGMVLQGSEIKSIRKGKASVKEAYCFISNGELWIKNMNISIYEEASYANHEPLRDRKLLLNDVELAKIEKKLKDAGITIIPLKVFVNQKGWAKIEIALARGKKLFDKREDIKKKDVDRQLDRIKKVKR